MPARKAARRAERRHEVKLPHRTRAKTMVTRARRALRSGQAGEAEGAVRRAEAALDHAATKHAVHRNAAARRKARLWRQLERLRGDGQPAGL